MFFTFFKTHAFLPQNTVTPTIKCIFSFFIFISNACLDIRNVRHPHFCRHPLCLTQVEVGAPALGVSLRCFDVSYSNLMSILLFSKYETNQTSMIRSNISIDSKKNSRESVPKVSVISHLKR